MLFMVKYPVIIVSHKTLRLNYDTFSQEYYFVDF